MKRVYVNEKWCLGCHLCEYYCAFASTIIDLYRKLPRHTSHTRLEYSKT